MKKATITFLAFLDSELVLGQEKRIIKNSSFFKEALGIPFVFGLGYRINTKICGVAIIYFFNHNIALLTKEETNAKYPQIVELLDEITSSICYRYGLRTSERQVWGKSQFKTIGLENNTFGITMALGIH